MTYSIWYSEVLTYQEEIEASNADEASEKFINKLTENTIDPSMTEIDYYEIKKDVALDEGGDGSEKGKERGKRTWQTNH